MACPDLFFNHQGSFSNDITISTRFLQVDLLTTIFACLHNGSNFDGSGRVDLYWASLSANGTLGLPTQLFVSGVPNPLRPLTIPANGSCTFQYTWAPDSSVSSDPTNPNQLVIFAQAIAQPVQGPDGCSGWWNRGDFNMNEPYNGAQMFQFSSIPF
jgi:hypothetical protein